MFSRCTRWCNILGQGIRCEPDHQPLLLGLHLFGRPLTQFYAGDAIVQACDLSSDGPIAHAGLVHSVAESQLGAPCFAEQGARPGDAVTVADQPGRLPCGLADDLAYLAGLDTEPNPEDRETTRLVLDLFAVRGSRRFGRDGRARRLGRYCRLEKAAAPGGPMNSSGRPPPGAGSAWASLGQRRHPAQSRSAASSPSIGWHPPASATPSGRVAGDANLHVPIAQALDQPAIAHLS